MRKARKPKNQELLQRPESEIIDPQALTKRGIRKFKRENPNLKFTDWLNQLYRWDLLKLDEEALIQSKIIKDVINVWFTIEIKQEPEKKDFLLIISVIQFLLAMRINRIKITKNKDLNYISFNLKKIYPF